MCYWLNGTVNLTELAAKGEAHTLVFSTLLPLLLFSGAVGKSAQLPLHVWLPDAMEGPTPVSALIHAATMVAAGIYMLCRINVLMVPAALDVIMWTGTVTALYAALCAITQSDIKKVLAYSTLSQLGFMVAAFGLGSLSSTHLHGTEPHTVVIAAGVGAAMFHLTTHAFFKALMFLGSGSVIHGCHHEQDIFKMGGLRTRMPLTFWTFTIGVAAIIGFPYLAGFFSKDAILYLAFEKNSSVFALLALTAVLTSSIWCASGNLPSSARRAVTTRRTPTKAASRLLCPSCSSRCFHSSPVTRRFTRTFSPASSTTSPKPTALIIRSFSSPASA